MHYAVSWEDCIDFPRETDGEIAFPSRTSFKYSLGDIRRSSYCPPLSPHDRRLILRGLAFPWRTSFKYGLGDIRRSPYFPLLSPHDRRLMLRDLGLPQARAIHCTLNNLGETKRPKANNVFTAKVCFPSGRRIPMAWRYRRFSFVRSLFLADQKDHDRSRQRKILVALLEKHGNRRLEPWHKLPKDRHLLKSSSHIPLDSIAETLIAGMNFSQSEAVRCPVCRTGVIPKEENITDLNLNRYVDALTRTANYNRSCPLCQCYVSPLRVERLLRHSETTLFGFSKRMRGAPEHRASVRVISSEQHADKKGDPAKLDEQTQVLPDDKEALKEVLTVHPIPITTRYRAKQRREYIALLQKESTIRTFQQPSQLEEKPKERFEEMERAEEPSPQVDRTVAASGKTSQARKTSALQRRNPHLRSRDHRTSISQGVLCVKNADLFSHPSWHLRETKEAAKKEESFARKPLRRLQRRNYCQEQQKPLMDEGMLQPVGEYGRLSQGKEKTSQPDEEKEKLPGLKEDVADSTRSPSLPASSAAVQSLGECEEDAADTICSCSSSPREEEARATESFDGGAKDDAEWVMWNRIGRSSIADILVQETALIVADMDVLEEKFAIPLAGKEEWSAEQSSSPSSITVASSSEDLKEEIGFPEQNPKTSREVSTEEEMKTTWMRKVKCLLLLDFAMKTAKTESEAHAPELMPQLDEKIRDIEEQILITMSERMYDDDESVMTAIKDVQRKLSDIVKEEHKALSATMTARMVGKGSLTQSKEDLLVKPAEDAASKEGLTRRSTLEESGRAKVKESILLETSAKPYSLPQSVRETRSKSEETGAAFPKVQARLKDQVEESTFIMSAALPKPSSPAEKTSKKSRRAIGTLSQPQPQRTLQAKKTGPLASVPLLPFPSERNRKKMAEEMERKEEVSSVLKEKMKKEEETLKVEKSKGGAWKTAMKKAGYMIPLRQQLKKQREMTRVPSLLSEEEAAHAQVQVSATPQEEPMPQADETDTALQDEEKYTTSACALRSPSVEVEERLGTFEGRASLASFAPQMELLLQVEQAGISRTSSEEERDKTFKFVECKRKVSMTYTDQLNQAMVSVISRASTFPVISIDEEREVVLKMMQEEGADLSSLHADRVDRLVATIVEVKRRISCTSSIVEVTQEVIDSKKGGVEFSEQLDEAIKRVLSEAIVDPPVPLEEKREVILKMMEEEGAEALVMSADDLDRLVDKIVAEEKKKRLFLSLEEQAQKVLGIHKEEKEMVDSLSMQYEEEEVEFTTKIQMPEMSTLFQGKLAEAARGSHAEKPETAVSSAPELSEQAVVVPGMDRSPSVCEDNYDDVALEGETSEDHPNITRQSLNAILTGGIDKLLQGSRQSRPGSDLMQELFLIRMLDVLPEALLTKCQKLLEAERSGVIGESDHSVGVGVPPSTDKKDIAVEPSEQTCNSESPIPGPGAAEGRRSKRQRGQSAVFGLSAKASDSSLRPRKDEQVRKLSRKREPQASGSQSPLPRQFLSKRSKISGASAGAITSLREEDGEDEGRLSVERLADSGKIGETRTTTAPIGDRDPSGTVQQLREVLSAANVPVRERTMRQTSVPLEDEDLTPHTQPGSLTRQQLSSAATLSLSNFLGEGRCRRILDKFRRTGLVDEDEEMVLETQLLSVKEAKRREDVPGVSPSESEQGRRRENSRVAEKEILLHQRRRGKDRVSIGRKFSGVIRRKEKLDFDGRVAAIWNRLFSTAAPKRPRSRSFKTMPLGGEAKDEGEWEEVLERQEDDGVEKKGAQTSTEEGEEKTRTRQLLSKEKEETSTDWSISRVSAASKPPLLPGLDHLPTQSQSRKSASPRKKAMFVSIGDIDRVVVKRPRRIKTPYSATVKEIPKDEAEHSELKGDMLQSQAGHWGTDGEGGKETGGDESWPSADGATQRKPQYESTTLENSEMSHSGKGTKVLSMGALQRNSFLWDLVRKNIAENDTKRKILGYFQTHSSLPPFHPSSPTLHARVSLPSCPYLSSSSSSVSFSSRPSLPSSSSSVSFSSRPSLSSSSISCSSSASRSSWSLSSRHSSIEEEKTTLPERLVSTAEEKTKQVSHQMVKLVMKYSLKVKRLRKRHGKADCKIFAFARTRRLMACHSWELFKYSRHVGPPMNFKPYFESLLFDRRRFNVGVPAKSLTVEQIAEMVRLLRLSLGTRGLIEQRKCWHLQKQEFPYYYFFSGEDPPEHGANATCADLLGVELFPPIKKEEKSSVERVQSSSPLSFCTSECVNEDAMSSSINPYYSLGEAILCDQGKDDRTPKSSHTQAAHDVSSNAVCAAADRPAESDTVADRKPKSPLANRMALDTHNVSSKKRPWTRLLSIRRLPSTESEKSGEADRPLGTTEVVSIRNLPIERQIPHSETKLSLPRSSSISSLQKVDHQGRPTEKRQLTRRDLPGTGDNDGGEASGHAKTFPRSVPRMRSFPLVHSETQHEAKTTDPISTLSKRRQSLENVRSSISPTQSINEKHDYTERSPNQCMVRISPEPELFASEDSSIDCAKLPRNPEVSLLLNNSSQPRGRTEGRDTRSEPSTRVAECPGSPPPYTLPLSFAPETLDAFDIQPVPRHSSLFWLYSTDIDLNWWKGKDESSFQQRQHLAPPSTTESSFASQSTSQTSFVEEVTINPLPKHYSSPSSRGRFTPCERSMTELLPMSTGNCIKTSLSSSRFPTEDVVRKEGGPSRHLRDMLRLKTGDTSTRKESSVMPPDGADSRISRASPSCGGHPGQSLGKRSMWAGKSVSLCFLQKGEQPRDNDRAMSRNVSASASVSRLVRGRLPDGPARERSSQGKPVLPPEVANPAKTSPKIPSAQFLKPPFGRSDIRRIKNCWEPLPPVVQRKYTEKHKM